MSEWIELDHKKYRSLYVDSTEGRHYGIERDDRDFLYNGKSIISLVLYDRYLATLCVSATEYKQMNEMRDMVEIKPRVKDFIFIELEKRLQIMLGRNDVKDTVRIVVHRLELSVGSTPNWNSINDMADFKFIVDFTIFMDRNTLNLLKLKGVV